MILRDVVNAWNTLSAVKLKRTDTTLDLSLGGKGSREEGGGRRDLECGRGDGLYGFGMGW